MHINTTVGLSLVFTGRSSQQVSGPHFGHSTHARSLNAALIPNVRTLFRRGPLTRALNAGKNRDSRPVSRFIACCQRCAAVPWQVATLIAGSKRQSLFAE